MAHQGKENHKALSQKKQLVGTIERITYQSEDGAFTVARLAAQDGGEPVTVIGPLAGVVAGVNLELLGTWFKDPRHGLQFRVDSYTTRQPDTLKGMERYLGSGLIPGIGPGYAARIVGYFGLTTLEILDRDPDRLVEVDGLGGNRVAQIKEAWQEQRHVHGIMVFLQAHEISATYAAKILQTYGREALLVVKENPYRLAEDIRGIGFRRADRIALKGGMLKSDPRRVRAGLLFLLDDAASHGHCFVPQTELLTRCREMLGGDDTVSEASLVELVRDEKVVLAEDKVYPAPLYFAEQGVAKGLLRISGQSGWTQEKPKLDWIMKELGIELAEEQAQAVAMALTSRLAVITGGPGTGKSTILKVLLMLLAEKGVRLALAAPTGRAAKRMAEATGMEAVTIHRLLEYDRSVNGFRRNADNPLEVDLVVVDEASMLDIILGNALIRALAAGGGLLLVGDADQLPSVGPGNLLRDLIDCGKVPVTRLMRIFRQNMGSLISLNAARINNGQTLELLPGYHGDKDFYYISREKADEIEGEILSLCGGRLSRKYGFDPLRDIQVLTPMRKGGLGVDQLNIRLQEILNSSVGSANCRLGPFLIGDKVMQIRNNYDKEVFNGDLGFVSAIDPDEQQLTLEFEGRAVTYGSSELNELQLAYAITVHKAQGSEFPCVIMSVHTSHYPLLQRNLLYTGITRGRRLMILIGNRKALAIAVANNRVINRNSGLKGRLESGRL
ncbi:MAG: ATP-dependent RecD-like DNA helicase [Proteobacteria bacterium]|nr:ATP-dependent RecD-like DNA helicase [Pseudomonadota bacterium]MBU1687057.1 ATP-dependent RecD-like DNA helicase [Pseudomonadota bacterium]